MGQAVHAISSGLSCLSTFPTESWICIGVICFVF
jgi:hypothetical protein